MSAFRRSSHPVGSTADSIVEAELRRRAAEQHRSRTGRSGTLPPLLRIYAYVLLTISFFGYWIWIGSNVLVLWLLGLDQKDHGNQVPLFVGLTVGWTLLLPATLLWHAPELLKRPLGPPPRDAKGFAGYLLRHADDGVLGGRLELGAAAPPPHFWLVTVLSVLFSGSADLSAYAVVDGTVWRTVVWLGFVCSLLSLGILTHGALTRRAARRRAARERHETSGAPR